jgi:TatD DNase family protein
MPTKMPNNYLLHDTHLHLDILLEKLGHIDDIRSLDLAKPLTLSSEHKALLSQLLGQHEFAIQATVAWQNFAIAWQLFKDLDKVSFLFGSHPEIVTPEFNLDNYLDEQNAYLVENLANIELIGVGEIGLDYYYSQDKNIIQTQQSLFRHQLELAQQLKLPVVIHCRDAFQDLFSILQEYPRIQGRFIVHCFTGGIEEARQVVDMGGKIGIGGILTFNNGQQLREAVEFVRMEDIVLETDLPFLSPVPERGKVCLPEYIKHTGQKVAEIKNIDIEQVWADSKHNSLLVFEKLLAKLGGPKEYDTDESKSYTDFVRDS